jgi:predicted nucleic acid-binding protein
MILDTNALSAWLDGDPAIESRLAAAPLLAISVIVMGEYRFGISFSKYRAEYEQRVSLIEMDLPVLGAGMETAIHYAAIRKELKEAGTPIPWHDLWIAAQAREHSLAVLSRDSHFDYVRGLTRIGW